MAYVKKNIEVNGIEIYFEIKPSSQVLKSLKADGWHWHKKKSCWYNRYTEYNYYVANRICNEVNGNQNKPEKKETSSLKVVEHRENTSVETVNENYKKYAYENLSADKQQDIDYNDKIKQRIKESDAFAEAKPTQKKNALYKHQRAGCLLAEKYDKFAFFYDTGTGKTVMALDIINAKYQKDGSRFLIIAPKAIIQTAWVEDARTYYPEMRILPLIKSFKKFKRNKLLAQWKSLDTIGNMSIQRQDNYLNFLALMTGNEEVLGNDDEEEVEDNRTIEEMAQHFIINAELFIRDPERYIEEYNIDGIVVDESAVMKNYQSITSNAIIDACRGMKYVYLLSGKPAPNNELEYFSQMKAVDPETFWMSYDYFARDFGVNPNGNKVWLSSVAKETLSKLISARSLIISKDDCLDLPPTTEIVHSFELPDSIMREYDRLYKNCLAVIKGMDKSTRFYSSTSKLAVLMKLRQMTSGFFIMNNEEGKKTESQIIEIHERKLEELDNMVDLIGNEQVIIWCQFKYEIQKVEELLSKRGKVVTAYGGTKDVNQSIYDFKYGDAKYIIAHPKTLKYGVTFTNCRYAIYYSFSYSAEDYDQSHDRIYRLGQKEKCTFFFLHAENTIDELMYQKVMKKLSDAEFFEWLIKDASEHGIDYNSLKSQEDDDYKGVSDELLESIRDVISTNKESEIGEVLNLFELLGDSCGKVYAVEQTEAEKEIEELIELANVSYNDISKLHQIIDGMLSKCKELIHEPNNVEAVILRHRFDDKRETVRTWNWVGNILRKTGTTAHKYYVDGVRFIKRQFGDVLQYLTDVYIFDKKYEMSDEVHDKIFDCLMPNDPTDEEMAELIIPIKESEYIYATETKDIFVEFSDGSKQGIAVAAVNSYLDWCTFCVVLRFDGTKIDDYLMHNRVDEVIFCIDGEQVSYFPVTKFDIEDKAISYKVFTFESFPHNVEYGDIVEVYLNLSSEISAYKRTKIHFSVFVREEDSVPRNKEYPNGYPLDRLELKNTEMSYSAIRFLRQRGICTVEQLSKVSYTRLKLACNASKALIEEIRQVLNQYGLIFRGYEDAIEEERIAEMAKNFEADTRKKAFVERITQNNNIKIVKVTPICVIFDIASYGESFKQKIEVKSINKMPCKGVKATANVSKKQQNKLFRIDINKTSCFNWKLDESIDVEYEVSIGEYSYEKNITENVKVEAAFIELSANYSICENIIFDNQDIQIRYLATYLLDKQYCMLFRIQSGDCVYTSINWKELEIEENTFELSCEREGIGAKSTRLFYVMIKNPFLLKCTGCSKIKLDVGRNPKELEIDINCVCDEKFRLPSIQLPIDRTCSYWGMKQLISVLQGNLILESAEAFGEDYHLEFSYLSDLKGGDVDYLVYVNGDEVAKGVFKYSKGRKHLFNVTMSKEKLRFLGALQNRANCDMEMILWKWDSQSKTQRHGYARGIANLTELLMDSKYYR